MVHAHHNCSPGTQAAREKSRPTRRSVESLKENITHGGPQATLRILPLARDFYFQPLGDDDSEPIEDDSHSEVDLLEFGLNAYKLGRYEKEQK